MSPRSVTSTLHGAVFCSRLVERYASLLLFPLPNVIMHHCLSVRGLYAPLLASPEPVGGRYALVVFFLPLDITVSSQNFMFVFAA